MKALLYSIAISVFLFGCKTIAEGPITRGLIEISPIQVIESMGEVEPRVLSQLAHYPPKLESANKVGMVKVRYSIAADGTVSEIEVTESSDPAFSQSVIHALEGLRALPARRNDDPVSAKVAQVFNFKIVSVATRKAIAPVGE